MLFLYIIEPGFYEDGQFGVRIENVVLIKEADTKYHHKETTFLTMEPVTLVTTWKHVISLAIPFATGPHTTKDDCI